MLYFSEMESDINRTPAFSLMKIHLHIFNDLYWISLVINLRRLTCITKRYFYCFVIIILSPIYCGLLRRNSYFFSLQFLFSRMLKISDTIFRLPDNFHACSHSKYYVFNFLNYLHVVYWFWYLKCLAFSVFCTAFFHMYRVSSFSQSIFQVADNVVF